MKNYVLALLGLVVLVMACKKSHTDLSVDVRGHWQSVRSYGGWGGDVPFTGQKLRITDTRFQSFINDTLKADFSYTFANVQNPTGTYTVPCIRLEEENPLSPYSVKVSHDSMWLQPAFIMDAGGMVYVRIP